MMKFFHIDREKTINSALYILKSLGGQSDFHKLFKILYFADQKHLVKYGTPITGDTYVAMAHGPVPSKLYDRLKALRNIFGDNADDNGTFKIVENHFVSSLKEPDMDSLAPSNINCLNDAIHENKNLSFKALADKSHGEAWKAAEEQTEEIDFLAIASEGGATEEMLKYIRLNLENQNSILHAIAR